MHFTKDCSLGAPVEILNSRVAGAWPDNFVSIKPVQNLKTHSRFVI